MFRYVWLKLITVTMQITVIYDDDDDDDVEDYDDGDDRQL